jgi:hypothetical protein
MITSDAPRNKTNGSKEQIDFSLEVLLDENYTEADRKEAESLADLITKAVRDAMRKNGLSVVTKDLKPRKH